MSLEVKGEELGRMERNGTLFPVGFGKGVGDLPEMLPGFERGTHQGWKERN